MFALVICILALHRVNSVCNVTVKICTDRVEVQEEIVNLHNAFRRAVNPPAVLMAKMSWSDQLSANVQKWVDQCILRHGPRESRQIDGYRFGENLFYAGSAVSWTSIVTAWHNEVEHYVYPTGSNSSRAVGHFTQVVWCSSYKIGCAVKYCPERAIFLSGCHYFQVGNYAGIAPYTSGPSCTDCPDDCEDKLCTSPCAYEDMFVNCPTMKKEKGCESPMMDASCGATCKCSKRSLPHG
ncbi:cysteine-rich venom protein [Genypterus blacodes]|uniref:cysteine-rich venom protein n=1 Tax=Genypterus blacodes TaxID=154954 RepID=UPI003F75BA78